MSRIRCHDCGKFYHVQEDAFCPHCGAFNQPARTSRINSDGVVVRVDGINEAGHEGSFTHREFHKEERQRRRTGLDKNVQRPLSGIRPSAPGGRGNFSRQKKEKAANSELAKVIVWVVVALMILNVLSRILFFF